MGKPKSEKANENEKIASQFMLFTKYYWSDEIKEDKLGRICCTHGGYKKFLKKYCLENLNRKDCN